MSDHNTSEIEPPPTAAAEPEPASKPSRTLLAVAVALACAAAVLTVFGVVLNPPAESNQPAAGEPRPQPSQSQSASPMPAIAASVIPAECAKIYTRDWASELSPFVLNPAWSLEEPDIGTNDDALRQLLEPGVALTCHWGNSSGGGDTGIVTSLANIDERTANLAQSRIANLGWACSEQLGGVRCVTQGEDENGAWGESHFFRENVWLATRWSNLGPDGYTADIASTLWP